MSTDAEPSPTESRHPATRPAINPAMNPDRLAELEEERRFLLRSIADLEREREAGDVDDHDYRALRDGYTARAAVVLRAIDERRSALPPKAPRNWKRTIGITAAVIIIGVVAGILVSLYSGQRDPSDTITGGTSPNQVASLLSEGRALLEVNNYKESFDRFSAVLKIDPNNVEALTYAGWVAAISPQPVLPQAKQLLEAAIEVDPTYADPHCFLAIIATLFEDDPNGARVRETECLANDPSAEMRGLVALYVDPTLATG
jgi:tetratricopeptide (TPR) repeat protein